MNPSWIPHREIANLLGRSVGDSKSQLHKARKRLRESLGEFQRDKKRDQRLVLMNERGSSFGLDPGIVWKGRSLISGNAKRRTSR
jgi:hypothetical protein